MRCSRHEWLLFAQSLALLLHGEFWDLMQSNSWPGQTLCILSVAWPTSELFEEPSFTN